MASRTGHLGDMPVHAPNLANVHKRYLIHVAGHNRGILMPLLLGAGTPKEAAARGHLLLLVVQRKDAWRSLSSQRGDEGAILIVAFTANPT